MCGIAGWVSGNGESPDRDVLTRVTRAMAHRGPDAEGIVIQGPAGFGHRRLSIIDLSTSANQPMRDASGRYLIVFNGEIYNFQELRHELEAKGHSFSTKGDTEVLLESFKAWGPAALDRLVGMFALALWDSHRQVLMLARDRLGKKPLFYARLPDDGLVFASEPRALTQHPGVPGDIDPIALAHYLRLNYVPCDRSLLSGVRSLPPACYAQFNIDSGLRITRYWDLAAKFRQKRSFASNEAAAEELRALIDTAVGQRLVSDVPLGAFLSGGVDSSTIVASMLERRTRDSVLTFTSGFLEDSFDESPIAERIAAQWGITHRTQRLDPAQLDLLPAVIAAAGEPLADTSALPMYYLCGFTRQNVTVALSGDGGDECFAGYETYIADKLHRIAAHSPRWLRERANGILDPWLPVDHSKVGWPEKMRRFTFALGQEAPRAHASWRDIFAADELLGIMQGDWRQQVSGPAHQDLFADYFGKHFADVEGCDAIDQATYVDIKTWMVDDILVKADRTSMAHSLEVRCPLLDHRVVEFAAQLPPSMKLHGLSKKYLLKRSQRSRLPTWLLDRKKQGFNAPVSQWLLGPLRQRCQDMLFSQPMLQWFDRGQLQRLWDQHDRMQRDNGLKLFGLLTVAMFIESSSTPQSPAQRPALFSA
jgi:asparagine synthase (glutamine-hydrolysing)